MPLVDWSIEATWQQAYRVPIRDQAHPLFGQSVTYGRMLANRYENPYADDLAHYKKRAQFLINHIQPFYTPGDRALIVGCGYGYLLEALKIKGIPNVWGIDLSSYLEVHHNDVADPLTGMAERHPGSGIVWEAAQDLDKNRVRNKLVTMTGDWHFDWIVTEEVVESLTNSELTTLANAMETVLSSGLSLKRIINVVADHKEGMRHNPALPMRWLSMDAWVALAPQYTWVSSFTGQVVT